MPQKNKKSPGRPAKYITDDKGREIIGLSYNKSNNMFYVTGSKPRHYLIAGEKDLNKNDKDNFALRKKRAIQEFNKYIKIHKLSPEKQEEQKTKDAIYKKAKKLIEDGFMDKFIYEKVYDLISDDPVKASFELGIKNLVFLSDKNFSYPFTLDLVWELFKHHRYVKDPKKFKKHENAWNEFRKHFKAKTPSGITKEKVDDWLDKLYEDFNDTQRIDIFSCLDAIFSNVLKRNYKSESVNDVIELIRQTYKEIS